MCALQRYVLQILLHQVQVPAIVKPLELWTGKQVMSVMVRPSLMCPILINLDLKEKDHDSGKDMKQMDTRDGYVCIRNSELISGRIGKGLLGGSKGGLFGTLAARYSPAVAGVCSSPLCFLLVL